MAENPIPATVFFQDFAFDLKDYQVLRNSILVDHAQGLSNRDEGGKHIAFLYGLEIYPGDVLVSNGSQFTVRSVGYDTFQGKPDLIKAYI